MNMQLEAALKYVKKLEGDIEYYKTTADLLQTQLEETEDAFKACRGQLKALLQDAQYPAQAVNQ